MTALLKQGMTVDEYLAWAVTKPGRYELYGGEVFAMAPETADHADAKGGAYAAIRADIARKKLPCHVFPDGMTVRVDADTAYEPDVSVHCGEKTPSQSMEVAAPVILIEVLSRSTRHIDVSLKLTGYFKLPSVKHYLVCDTDKRLVIHHARGQGDTIITRIVTEGALRLDPPGIEIALADVFPP